MACTTLQVASIKWGSAGASCKHCCSSPSLKTSSPIAGPFLEVRPIQVKTKAGRSWAEKHAVTLDEREGLERQPAPQQRWRLGVHSGVASRSSETNGVATPERLPSPAIVDQDGDLDEDWEAAWTPQDAADLYRVEGWGSPYFSINARGNVAIRPKGSEDGELLLAGQHLAFVEANLFELASSLYDHHSSMTVCQSLSLGLGSSLEV